MSLCNELRCPGTRAMATCRTTSSTSSLGESTTTLQSATFGLALTIDYFCTAKKMQLNFKLANLHFSKNKPGQGHRRTLLTDNTCGGVQIRMK